MLKTRIIGALTAVALVAGGTVAVTTQASAPRKTDQQTTATKRKPQAAGGGRTAKPRAASQADLSRSFGAFRRAQRADDVPSKRVQNFLSSGALPTPADAGKIRRIGPREYEVYAAPSGSSVCSVVVDPPELGSGYSGGCSTIADAVAGRVGGIVGFDDKTLVWGMAPDGYSQYRLDSASSAISASSADSAYVGVIGGEATGVSWRNGDVREGRSLGRP